MATTTNFNWETPDDTDLVKDGAAAIRTLGSSIDSSFVDLKGGTSGQVLSKASNADLDFTWVAQDDSNAIQNAIVDAKGDIIVATAADTPARLAVGTNGQVLTADSAEATGLKWATAGGGGLNLITRQTVTSAADTGSSFAGVFTSTYNSYLCIIETGGSNSANVQMQFKSGTNTNHTGADYYGNSAYVLYNGTSFSFLTTVGATAYNLIQGMTTDTQVAIWINGVGNTSARATWSGTSIAGSNNQIHTFGGLLASSNTWTGLNFKQASGNISITAAIYGLAK